MRDGLYKVSFITQLGEGAGVVHLQSGRLWGGDSGIYYVGTYVVADDKFSANVQTDRHTKYPGIQSVFGIDRASITLQGMVKGDAADMTGTAKEAPGISFKARLSRISD